MLQTTDGASMGEALTGFLAEHGRCWRVSGEDLTLVEGRTVLWLTCPGCGTSVTVPR